MIMDDTLIDAIAARIIILCKEKKTTPYAIARISGLDKATMYSILSKRSRSPEITTIKKICDGLGISLSEFFRAPEFE